MNISQPWKKCLGYLIQNKPKFKKSWDREKVWVRVWVTQGVAPNIIHNSHSMRRIVGFWTNIINLLHLEGQEGSKIREGEETTISKFLSRLYLDIRYRVELLPYQDLNDLVQICIKVKQQRLRKGLKDNHSISYVKRDYKREENKWKKRNPLENLRKKKRTLGRDHHHSCA